METKDSLKVDLIDNVEQILPEEDQLSTRDIRRNMIFIILLDAIFATGWTDIDIALQPLLVDLGASNTMIGLIRGANWAGLLGVFLSPWITRRYRYKKWYMFVAHIPYLAALGVVGLGVIYSRQLGMTDTGLTTFLLVAFLAHWFFAGFVSLPHQEYVTACIPMSYRGRYTGFSFSIGGAVSVLSALVGGMILLKVEKPVAYGYLFVMAWAIIQSGYLFALFAKERPTPVEKSPKPWTKNMVKAAWSDKPYIKLLAVNVFVAVLLLPVFPFVNIYGFKTLGMIPATAAIIQIITQIARIGFSFLIGILTDKLGPKRVMPYWMLVAGLALIPPVLIRNSFGVYASVALSTVFIAGVTASFMALIYGIPKPEHRAGHFTIQLIVIYAANAIGPFLVGRICDAMPYRTVFVIFAVVAFAFFPVAKYMASSLKDNAEDYS